MKKAKAKTTKKAKKVIKWKQITFCIDPAQLKKLKQLAKSNAVSISKMCRLAVDNL